MAKSTGEPVTTDQQLSGLMTQAVRQTEMCAVRGQKVPGGLQHFADRQRRMYRAFLPESIDKERSENHSFVNGSSFPEILVESFKQVERCFSCLISTHHRL